MAFIFSSTAGTSGITTITVSADSRQELSTLVQNFTLANDDKSVLMAVAQRAYVPTEKFITLSPSAITWDSSGGTGSITVHSNDDWVLSADPWITISRMEQDRGGTLSGNGNTIIGIRATENTGNTRTGTISGHCLSNTAMTASTTVQQSGSYVAPYITLNTGSMSIPSSGASGLAITVESNLYWSVECGSDWITATTVSGTNNGTVYFNVDENQQNISRNDIIYVINDEYAIKQQCEITQSAATQSIPYLTVSPTGSTIQSSGGSFVITVSSNTSWSTSINYDGNYEKAWISIDKLNGYGDDEVVVTVSPMNGEQESATRGAYIGFYNNTYGIKCETTIEQLG